MSFAHNLTNGKSSDLQHIPKNPTGPIHEHDKNGWKNSHTLVLPPMSKYGGSIRSKPQSGFNQATLISSQGQLDYHLNSSGYVSDILLEMELTISNNPVTVIPMYLIDRVELLCSEGNIISTIYGDLCYTDKLHTTLEQHNRVKGIENLDSSYNGVAIPVGQKRLIFSIPCFIRGCRLKLNTIKSKIITRIYFSALGVTSGLATDITVQLCDIIQNGTQLSGPLEALETQRKLNANLHFRFLNPVRAASQTISMVPSNYYDVRLTSSNNISAFLIFMIRPNPITSSNVNTYQAIEYFELLDQDNTIVGLKTSHEYHKIHSNQFNGDILNFKNIYTIPFAIDVNAANNGAQSGFYAMSSNEILRLYMPSTLVAGSFRVDVYSFEYNRLSIDHGVLSVSK